jgi:uncharacterized protein (UPF0332 family)
MSRFKSSKEAFTSCEQAGSYTLQEQVDLVKIRHMVSLAQADLEFARAKMPTLPKDSMQWSTVFKLHYDAFHQLVEAFLCFERMKSDKHQCLFAFLIEKHAELDLEWGFLERMRTARNGIQYYGSPVSAKEWDEMALQINLYIKTMKNAVDERIRTVK